MSETTGGITEFMAWSDTLDQLSQAARDLASRFTQAIKDTPTILPEDCPALVALRKRWGLEGAAPPFGDGIDDAAGKAARDLDRLATDVRLAVKDALQNFEWAIRKHADAGVGGLVSGKAVGESLASWRHETDGRWYSIGLYNSLPADHPLRQLLRPEDCPKSGAGRVVVLGQCRGEKHRSWYAIGGPVGTVELTKDWAKWQAEDSRRREEETRKKIAEEAERMERLSTTPEERELKKLRQELQALKAQVSGTTG